MSVRSRQGTDVPAAGSRMEPEYELTKEQWQLIADLVPHAPPSVEGGRPRVEPRACVEGIIWILRSGARWKDMPKHFPSATTCWRRLQEWSKAGIWEMAWGRQLRKLDRQGRVNREESMADGTYASAKNGVLRLAKRNAAKGPRSWSFSTDMAFYSASTRPAPALTK